MLPIRAVRSPVRYFDDAMLGVLRWVSERYVAPLATVIDRASPPRVASEDDAELPAAADAGVPPPAPSTPGGGSGDADAHVLHDCRGGARLLSALRDGAGAFVVRPAPEDEIPLAVEAVGAAIAAGRGAIVLVPEASPLPATAAAIVAAFGGRVALHLGGSRRARYRTWLEIRDARYDVVVGTRPSVFAPVARLGLIYVSRESHPGHREERSPYYHVRDVAIARARLGRCVCVASAIFPSSEAATAGAESVEPKVRRWPPVEVVRPGPEGRAPRLVAALREARRAFLYAPMPGYGLAQVCRSCGSPAACARCGGVLRRERGEIRCIVCGAPGRCATCGSGDFGIRRGGAERVEEWAGRVASVGVRRAAGDGAEQGARPSEAQIVVGGADAVKDVDPPSLDLVGILDADLASRRPGMGALERSLATWAEAAGWARPHGRVIVQSSRPNDPAVQALVAGRPERFQRAERARRADAGFPVGAPVFRVSGTPEIEAALQKLEPVTLLTTSREDQTVCLLVLEPDRVGAFGRAARELAVEETLTRVEAEPHL